MKFFVILKYMIKCLVSIELFDINVIDLAKGVLYQ
jgi:hypothetical protein